LRLQHGDLAVGAVFVILQAEPVLLVVDGAVPLGSSLQLQDQVQGALLGVQLVLNLEY
jgi:hypothetical protein